MEKRKKAQVSVFIVLGIIVIALVGAFIYFKSSKQDNLNKALETIGVKEEAEALRNSILDCIKESARSSLIVIGIQGGYCEKPGDEYDLGFAFIPYYYDLGKILMPSKGKIENELGKCVDKVLGDCVNSLEYEDLKITYGDSRTSARIEKDKVTFNSELKVNIQKGDSRVEYEFKDTPIDLRSKLWDIYEVAKYITDSHREDPNFICINCLVDMAEKRNLYVDMLKFGEDSTLIVISENETMEEPYVFEFLNRYPLNNEK